MGKHLYYVAESAPKQYFFCNLNEIARFTENGAASTLIFKA